MIDLFPENARGRYLQNDRIAQFFKYFYAH